MTTKSNGSSSNKVQEFQFKTRPNITKWQAFKKEIYDPSKKEFCGRTKKSWFQLLIFYTIFYSVLAVFCAICMKGLISTLSDKEPKWKLSESLIGTNPGIAFRPILGESTEITQIIRYNVDNSTSQNLIKVIDKFLEPYRMEQVGKNYKDCGFQEEACDHQVCTFKVDELGECMDNFYGYTSLSPCVFLKINRIFGWKPEVHTEGEDEMPSDLKKVIENATKLNETKVWINCIGVNAADKERISGFNYYPSQGFPSYYFPYRNNDNYLSPVVAVQILNVTLDTTIKIECRAWAKNINYYGGVKDRQGSVQFEVLVNS